MEVELAEISKNYFLITSLIAPVSSLSFRTIRRTSCGAPGLTATLTLAHSSHTETQDGKTELG